MDLEGGSTLEFYGQTATLQVNNNAYIQAAENTSDLNPPNQILFDTDVTQPGTASKDLATTSTDSFIDNYGIITRSNRGTYQIDLPIRNNFNQYHSGVLDVQSKLWISGASPNKTANRSLDQEDGQTILEGEAELKVNSGVIVRAGDLFTYGGRAASILNDDPTVTTLTVEGGTIKVSADDPTLYGWLTVLGSMRWTGGTFEAYVNGSAASRQTELHVGNDLPLTAVPICTSTSLAR